MRHTSVRVVAVVAFQGFSLVLASRHAFAQNVDSTTLAAAQVLHDEAVVSLDNRDYATACPKLERVVAMIPTGIGAMLTLAECYEGDGRLASAWKTYVRAQNAAVKQAQHERSAHARKKVAEILPKLSRLTITLEPTLMATVGLEVRLDGELLAKNVWGEAIPVDRGNHTISVKMPKGKEWQQPAHFAADATSLTVNVSEPEEPKGIPPTSGMESNGKMGSPGSQPGERPALGDDAFWGTQRVIGAVVAGVGVAGLGLGTFFGLRAISKKNESNAEGHCSDGNQCDEVGYSLREDSYTAGNFSTAFFVAGGIGLATGVTIFVTAPKRAGASVANISCSPLWASAQCSISW